MSNNEQQETKRELNFGLWLGTIICGVAIMGIIFPIIFSVLAHLL